MPLGTSLGFLDPRQQHAQAHQNAVTAATSGLGGQPMQMGLGAPVPSGGGLGDLFSDPTMMTGLSLLAASRSRNPSGALLQSLPQIGQMAAQQRQTRMQEEERARRAQLFNDYVSNGLPEGVPEHLRQAWLLQGPEALGSITEALTPEYGVHQGYGYGHDATGFRWGDARGMTPTEESDAAIRRRGNDISAYSAETARMNAETSRDQFEASQSGEPEINFTNERQFTDEFESDPRVAGFSEAARAYQSMTQLAQEGAGASDVALVFSFFKTIDPSSTVREGEYAAAASAMGLPAQIVTMFRSLDSGERLSPQLRNDLVNVAEQYLRQHEAQYEQALQFYGGLAPQYGMAPERVIYDIRPEGGIGYGVGDGGALGSARRNGLE